MLKTTSGKNEQALLQEALTQQGLLDKEQQKVQGLEDAPKEHKNVVLRLQGEKTEHTKAIQKLEHENVCLVKENRKLNNTLETQSRGIVRRMWQRSHHRWFDCVNGMCQRDEHTVSARIGEGEGRA